MHRYSNHITPPVSQHLLQYVYICRVLLTDGDVEEPEAAKYYGTHGNSGVHLPINYQLARVSGSPGGTAMRTLVENWIIRIPREGVPVWTVRDSFSQ